MPEAERGQAIQAALAQHLDPQAVGERLALFRRLTADLQLSCLVSFFLVFILVPLLVWLDAAMPLLTLGVCYLGMALLGTLQFYRAHLILYPEEKLDRFKNVLLVLLSPADASHARDKLAHPLLGEYSPLAVARVLCGKTRFEEFAANAWRDLENPMLPICPVAVSAPQKTEAWFRACLHGLIKKLLTDSGVESGPLLAPPVPDHPTSRSYCPRCLGQYVLVSGTCPDCGGRPLKTWNSDDHRTRTTGRPNV